MSPLNKSSEWVFDLLEEMFKKMRKADKETWSLNEEVLECVKRKRFDKKRMKTERTADIKVEDFRINVAFHWFGNFL